RQSMTNRFFATAVAGFLLLAGQAAAGAEQDRAAPPGLARQGQEVVTKVYSLRDVIHATAFGATAPAAPVPAAVEGGGGGMGGGGFGGGGGGGGGGVPVRRRVDQAEERAED